MTTLKAFHGDPKIRAKYLRRVRAHRKADELVQGIGWVSNGVTRGCAVGCTLDAYDHSRYPKEIGHPLHLAYLEDRLFEMLPRKQALAWPVRFLSALTDAQIRRGTDLSGVFGQWAVWMLTDHEDGVINLAGDRKDVREAILGVADCWRRGATPEEFRKAAGAAELAAWWAADAARAAARAAELAAGAAEWTIAAADKLIALMRAA